YALKRKSERLDDEIVDRDLVGRLAFLVLAGGGGDLFAGGDELVDVAVHREIEMRDGQLRLEQAARDHFADVVVRNDLIRTRFEQGPDLVVGRHLHGERGRDRRGGRSRGGKPLARFGRFDVARDDAA